MTTITSIQKSSRPTCRLTGKAFWPLFGREVSVAMGAAGEVSLAHAQGCADQLLCPAPGVEEQLLAACVQAFRDAEECQGEPVSFLFEFEGMDQPQGLEERLKARYPGLVYHVFDGSSRCWRSRQDYPFHKDRKSVV